MKTSTQLLALFALVLNLSSCAYLGLNDDDESQETTQSVQQVIEKPHTDPVETKETPTQKSTSSYSFTNSTPADKALGWLKNGNIRFVKYNLRKDGQSKADIARLSSSQAPHSIILSCSDSRVPPEIIFDQKLGEIYTIRNLGHIADSSSIASIEYALIHYGVQNLVVLGHTSCDAIKGSVASLAGKSAETPELQKINEQIQPHMTELGGKELSKNYEDEAWAHTNGVIQDLVSRSKIISERVRSGLLKINGGVYSVETGKVDFSH